jgi:hypothetical protein
MKTFELLKNGNIAQSVWANKETKEIYPANRNSFGYNAQYVLADWFYNKYGKSMKTTQGKADSSKFYYSAKSMAENGFVLCLRGTAPLF